ncbi:MAG TPA: hypothetical protein VGL32_05205 [Acidimicrobiales bacterium]
MIRRSLLVAPIVLMAMGLGSVSIDLAAPAGASTPPPVRVAASGSPWFCLAVTEINFGYCQYNPLG